MVLHPVCPLYHRAAASARANPIPLTTSRLVIVLQIGQTNFVIVDNALDLDCQIQGDETGTALDEVSGTKAKVKHTYLTAAEIRPWVPTAARVPVVTP